MSVCVPTMMASLRKVFEYTLLVIVTLVSAAIMYWVSVRSDATAQTQKATVSLPPPVAQPRPIVAVTHVTPALCEVTNKYSGKLREWEHYTLAFEQAGRIVELGTNAQGQPLDDGDRVAKGQLLARMDDRVLRARVSEAVAQLEQTQSDLERVRTLRERDISVLTDAEYQNYLTQQALAKAGQEVALKQLEDAQIISPVDGVISRRLAEPGESVSANQTIFEIVQNDDLLLVVDVPESDIRMFEDRRQAVVAANATSSGSSDPEERVFRAHVQPEGTDRFGERWPPIEAEVYRIAELADQRTGLFEVEIRVPNRESILRPGMVATAEVVTSRISAYRIPESAVLFHSREGRPERFVFAVDQQPRDMQVMFWDVAAKDVPVVRRVDLPVMIDQGRELLVPSESLELGDIVVRGQQRLSDGKLVRIADPAEGNGLAAPAGREETARDEG